MHNNGSIHVLCSMANFVAQQNHNTGTVGLWTSDIWTCHEAGSDSRWRRQFVQCFALQHSMG